MQPSPAYPTQPQQMQYQQTGQYGAPGQVYGVPPPPYSETPSQVAPSAMYSVSYQQMQTAWLKIKTLLFLSYFCGKKNIS